ncbi:unnamed protein product, partial [Hymenolepis diminuta]
DEHNLSAEVKALLAKFEGSKYVDSSITPKSSVPSSHSIKSFVSVEILDHQLLKMSLKMFRSSFLILNQANSLE